MTKIAGAVVILTGASRGIGFELARVLLEKGAKVSVCARDQDKLDFAYNQLTQISKNLFSLSVDLSSPQEVERFFKASMAYFGTVDILINNAGVGLFEEVEKSDEKDITKIFSINFFSPISLIKHCLPVFRKKSRGHIVNISSIISTHALYNQGYYAASKAALNRITESIDAECKKDNSDPKNCDPKNCDPKCCDYKACPKEEKCASTSTCTGS